MSIDRRPLTEIRSDNDRTEECIAFLDEVSEVCRKYGYAIGHQDSHGAFEVYRYTVPAQLEPNLEWFKAADEVDWLSNPDPEDVPPPPDPFAGPIKDPFL